MGEIFWEDIFGRNYLVEISKEYWDMNGIYDFVKDFGIIKKGRRILDP